MTSKGIKRINRPHYRTAIVEIRSKKPQPKSFIKNGYSEEKKYWMKKHPIRVVTLILRGHDAACLCCSSLENLTFDHIIPKSKGGINGLSNGQILYKPCNNLKDDRIIDIKDLKTELRLKP